MWPGRTEEDHGALPIESDTECEVDVGTPPKRRSLWVEFFERGLKVALIEVGPDLVRKDEVSSSA